MSIEIYPTTFEAFDDEILIFKVEVFDEYTANVSISNLMNVKTWDEISPLIRKCLVDMRLEV